MSLPYQSFLFVPADNAKLLEKAHQRGADALILDLEDAVLPAGKPEARRGLPAPIDRLHGLGVPVLVRINSGWRDAVADLEAAVRPGVTALVVPKAEDAGALRVLSAMIGEWEVERGLTPGAIGLVALIESPLGLERLADIAAVPRVAALALGSEDFALTLGVEPTEALLALPCRQIALAAAARGLAAIGLPGSLAEFRDLDAYRAMVAQARAVGMTGALCIHPAQLAVVRDVFAPSAADVAWAGRVVAAWDEAQAAGRGAVSVDGRMVDRPVAERAKAILARTAATTKNAG
ncbi:CoA ester lyase (plasmid) [Azospirillum sp. TSH58]|uniref:HpcH/HpaI aldolase/citrate lyase family protein n=1 Tax=Azospirillum sp. TSH58 TaxID=664962 RepID=UPI000D60323F|nr:CoA ester lyase [Azospirillum sp. TSH58]AWJ86744.1 CoA ester lyase [Azospirillum sp. TSH58]PWC59983.1 hypothetical protein TSH58_29050 [Azospirillum sp. TSH58]